MCRRFFCLSFWFLPFLFEKFYSLTHLISSEVTPLPKCFLRQMYIVPSGNHQKVTIHLGTNRHHGNHQPMYQGKVIHYFCRDINYKSKISTFCDFGFLREMENVFTNHWFSSFSFSWYLVLRSFITKSYNYRWFWSVSWT